MNKVLIFFLLIGFYSCENKTKSSEIIKTVSELKDFELIQDFEKNKAEFNTEVFNLIGHSSDGGELKVFHDKKFNYVVYDFWLFGETGKLNYTYWTEKKGKLNFKFIKQLEYDYNKPFYVDGYKTDSLIHYLSYSDSKIKLFDMNKSEIKEPAQIKKAKTELESFYKDLIKGIEFIK